MKRLLSIFIVLLMFMIPLCVSAESNTDTSLEVNYSYDDGSGNIYVDARFVDIKVKSGIIYVIYDIKYDYKALELVKAESIMPENWSSLLENGVVEDMSREVSDGVYRWELGIFTVNKGIVNDNELGLKLEFKPKSEGTTVIKLEYYDVITEVVTNGMTEDLYSLSGKSIDLNIDLENPQTPEIDESDISVPEYSLPAESITEDTTVSSNESNYDTDNLVSMPTIGGNSQAEPDEETGPSWILWVVIGVGVIGVAAIVVVIVNSKKGKK